MVVGQDLCGVLGVATALFYTSNYVFQRAIVRPPWSQITEYVGGAKHQAGRSARLIQAAR